MSTATERFNEMFAMTPVLEEFIQLEVDRQSMIEYTFDKSGLRRKWFNTKDDLGLGKDDIALIRAYIKEQEDAGTPVAKPASSAVESIVLQLALSK